MKNNPRLLSVCLITYNHEAYIQQAIDSILNQQTSFSFDLIIADDCSSDATREILLANQKKHSERIHLILQENNVGPAQNWLDLINYPASEFIAYLEADDYWIGTSKLQEQIDWMQSHPETVLSFHNAVVKEKGHPDREFSQYSKDIYEVDEMFSSWIIPTASIVFRNCLRNQYPDWMKSATHGDLALFILLGEKGNFKAINKCMSVYRIHAGGITLNEFNSINHRIRHIQQLREMDKYFKGKYSSQFNLRILQYAGSCAYLLAKNKFGGTAIDMIKICAKIHFIKMVLNKYFYGALFYLTIYPTSWRKKH